MDIVSQRIKGDKLGFKIPSPLELFYKLAS